MRMVPSSSCRKIIKMGIPRAIFVPCAGFCSFHFSGQQFYFDEFSVSDGLSQSTVHHIIQDRNDLYWLGTRVGVASFNGVEFRQLYFH